MKSKQIKLVSQKHFLTSLLAISLMAMLTGCGGSSSGSGEEPEPPVDPTQQQMLQQAQATWNANAGDYYTLVYQKRCFCPSIDKLQVSVLDDSVLAALNLVTNEPLPSQQTQGISTVTEVFALIQEAINLNALMLNVTYNAQFGYPESVDIDYASNVADDELTFFMQDLVFHDTRLALDDVDWQLSAFNTIDGPQPLIDGSTISLTFDTNTATMSGDAGCNNYGATYILGDSDNSMIVEGIFSNAMACEPPAGVMEQELRYLGALSQVQWYFFDGSQLQLMVGADNVLQYSIKP